MKILLLIGIAVIKGISLHAQSCDSTWMIKDSSTVIFRNYDRSNNLDGQIIYEISPIQHKGVGQIAAIKAEGYNRRGIRQYTVEGQIKCSHGNLLWAMQLTKPALLLEKFKNFRLKSEESYLSYPANLHIGDSLVDGYTELNMLWKNKPILNVDVAITDRKVVSMDTIPLSFKTVKAFKIFYKATLRTTLLGLGIPVRINYEEWFAPGWGIIKSHTCSKRHKKSGYSEIVAVRNPLQ
jgi:hypothetical protein